MITDPGNVIVFCTVNYSSVVSGNKFNVWEETKLIDGK